MQNASRLRTAGVSVPELCGQLPHGVAQPGLQQHHVFAPVGVKAGKHLHGGEKVASSVARAACIKVSSSNFRRIIMSRTVHVKQC